MSDIKNVESRCDQCGWLIEMICQEEKNFFRDCPDRCDGCINQSARIERVREAVGVWAQCMTEFSDQLLQSEKNLLEALRRVDLYDENLVAEDRAFIDIVWQWRAGRDTMYEAQTAQALMRTEAAVTAYERMWQEFVARRMRQRNEAAK